jgi:hypothetical protein
MSDFIIPAVYVNTTIPEHLLKNSYTIDGTILANNLCFTVPNLGSKSYITEVIFDLIGLSGTGTVPTVSVGSTAGATDIIPATALTGLTTLNSFFKLTSTGLAKKATNIYVNVSSAATYATYKMNVSIIGYQVRKIWPAAASDLVAIATSDTAIDLTWTDNSENEVEFSIDRKIGDGAWTVNYDTTLNGDTAFTNTGLTAETLYSYRIRAVGEDGSVDYSGYSNTATATTEVTPIPVGDILYETTFTPNQNPWLGGGTADVPALTGTPLIPYEIVATFAGYKTLSQELSALPGGIGLYAGSYNPAGVSHLRITAKLGSTPVDGGSNVARVAFMSDLFGQYGYQIDAQYGQYTFNSGAGGIFGQLSAKTSFTENGIVPTANDDIIVDATATTLVLTVNGVIALSLGVLDGVVDYTAGGALYVMLSGTAPPTFKTGIKLESIV